MVSLRLKIRVFERDRWKCRDCNSDFSGDKFNNKLDIHHIIPKSVWGKDSFENLITLCKNCHRKAPHFPNKKLEEIAFNNYKESLKELSKKKKIIDKDRDDLWRISKKKIIFREFKWWLVRNKKVSGKKILQISKRIVKEHPEYFEALVEYEKTGELPKDFNKLRKGMEQDGRIYKYIF